MTLSKLAVSPSAVRIGGYRVRDSQWMVPAATLLALQYGIAFAIAKSISFAIRPVSLPYMLIALLFTATAGLFFLLRRLWALWKEGEAAPLSRLQHETDWIAVLTYALGFQLFALQIAALTWLKELIPQISTYWADPMLRTVERAILTKDAWQFVPEPFVSPLDKLYAMWAPVKFFALFAVLLRPASDFKARAIFAYFLSVAVFGTVGQFALASGGPIFYDRILGGTEFAPLLQRLHEHAPMVEATSNYLWQSYMTGESSIGGGISAMPSMHVTTTTWTAMVISGFWPKLKWPVWTFWCVILIGSVGLGWHYALDGVVGTAGALLCWRISPYFVRPRVGQSSIEVAA